MKKLHLFLALAIASLLVIGSTGCSAKAKAARHLQRANRFFDSGKYDSAEVEYINVLRNDPQNAKAFGRLGIIYFEEGRYQSAAPFLFRGSQLATNNVALHLKLGCIYLAMGKAKEARDEAGFVLARKPQDQDAPLLLAGAAATKKEISDARLQLQKLSAGGDKATVAVALGMLAFQERDVKTAAAAFRQAQALDPKSAAAYLAAGALLWEQNNLAAAEVDFKTAADLSPPRSPRRLQYAKFEMQTGNVVTAKNIFGEMIKTTPDYLPALIGLAEIALTEKKFDEVATTLNKALARDPESYDALLLNGRLDIARGETTKAVTELERLAKTFPQASRVYHPLGLAYLMNGEMAKAVASLNKAVSLDAHFTEAILLLAQIEIKNGEFDAAIASLKQLIASQPQLLPAQLLLADAYRAQGKPAAALAIYQQLGTSFPKNPQIPLLAGSTFLQQKNYAEALKEFTRAQELAPDSLVALEQLVNLDLIQTNYVRAMQRVETAIGKNPQQTAVRLLQAKVFIAQGNTAQAEVALLKAIALQPESSSAYLLLAQLYLNSKQNQKAVADLNTAVEKNPKNDSALMMLGMIYNAEKNYKAAAAAYEKLLEINPSFSPALNNLAYIYSEYLNQLDRAYELAQHARELLPDDPATADTLGWILCKKGQYRQALSVLLESAGKLSADPEVQFHLGRTYYALDEEASARTAFQRALQSKPDFSRRDECNKYLAVLAIDSKTADAATRTNLESWIAEKPNDLVALTRLAPIYQRAGALDKASATYETILKLSSENLGALTNLAQLCIQKDPQKAFGLAKAAYKLSPNDVNAAYLLGRLAFQTGNFQFATSLLQEVAKNWPANPQVLYDFAEATYSIGKVADAQGVMSNALEAGLASPQSDAARRFLDLIALSSNPTQAVAAESRVNEILKSDSNHVPALMVVAMLNEQKTDFIAAEQTYEKVLSRFPDFTPAQIKLATFYAEDSSKLERGYELALTARKSSPDDSQLGKALAIIAFRQGDYARALKLLKAIAAEQNADAKTFYYLGATQYRLKNRAESKGSLQRALSLNLPEKLSVDAKQMLAELK